MPWDLNNGMINIYYHHSKLPVYYCMDNSPIKHEKNVIRELVETGGHQLLLLPKYSPDLNDIEHNFSALKRARMYSPINTSIDEILRNYCAK